MPSTAQRKKRRNNIIAERHLREDAEARNAALENHIQALTQRPPAPRPGISTLWDWRCNCGRLVYAGKRNCDICGSSRAYSGTTVTGSLRGTLQASQVASAAIVRQQRVPGLDPQTYAAIVRAPPRHVQQERHKQQNGGLQGARTSVQPERAKPTKEEPAKAETAESEKREVPSSAKQCFETENEHDEDDQTTFEDADADPKVLRFRHINLCRKIEAKQKHLERQQESIEEQREEVARQQANLLELQAAADGTLEKIRELQGQSASIAQQIARIEETRKIGCDSTHTGPAEQQSPPEALAEECLSKAAAALQGFQAQSPQVQLLLQQFVTFIDQLRAGGAAQPVIDPRQSTLQQAFANAATTKPASKGVSEEMPQPSAEIPNAVPCFDISGSQPGDEQASDAVQTGAAPMAVVGECVGDKRKSDVLDDSEPVQAAKIPAAILVPPQTSQSLGTPMQVPLQAVPAFVPQTRAELRESLALRNKQQCQERKARTEAQHQKSRPY